MLTLLLSYFAAGTCTERVIFGIPTWYRYLLKNKLMSVDPNTGRCEISDKLAFQDISLVGLALVDIALHIAALVAVGYVLYGGIQFITAQGEADHIKKARQTIINALIGLVIALISTGLVSFIGTQIGKP